MIRASEPIPGSQETNSQRSYHTYTLVTFRVCIGVEPTTKVQSTSGDSNHLSDGTPNQKRIAIEPQPKREKYKNNRKREREKEI